jgi:hypothetical protein
MTQTILDTTTRPPKSDFLVSMYAVPKRASKGGFQSPTRKQGWISKPDAQARVDFKARRASKGCFLLACEETLARASLKSTLACASGFEIHPCLRVGL